MALTQANVAAVFKETYRDACPIMYANWDSAVSRIKARADVEKFGPRSIRAPKKMSPPGMYRIFSPDGGDLGRGGGGTWDAATFTPLPSLEAIEWNKSAEWYTANREISVVDATKDLMSDSMQEFITQDNMEFNTSGNAVRATIESGAGTTSLVLTAPYGTKRVRPGNRYATYSANLLTQRTGGTTLMTVTSIDAPNRTIVVDGNPTGQIDTDVLLAEGNTGASPVGFYGLRYNMNAATSGTWDGLSRSTYPQIRTPNVVVSAALTTAPIRLLKNLIINARGNNVFKSGAWEWYGHMAQQAAYEELAITIQDIRREGTDRPGAELLFDPTKLRIDGVPMLTDATCDTTTLDLVDWKNWWKAESLPVGLYDVDDDTLFAIYGASGGVAAAVISYIVNIKQWSVDDPQRGGYLSSLAVPSGYF